jgi:hypothetical protein
MVLEKNIGGFNISMKNFILVQKRNGFSKLLKNCEILKVSILIEIVVWGIGNFSEKISSFKSSHYCAFSYSIYTAFCDV